MRKIGTLELFMRLKEQKRAKIKKKIIVVYLLNRSEIFHFENGINLKETFEVRVFEFFLLEIGRDLLFFENFGPEGKGKKETCENFLPKNFPKILESLKKSF